LLIIPIQGSSNKLLDQIKKATEKRIKTEADEEKEVPDSALSLDELAARELIRGNLYTVHENVLLNIIKLQKQKIAV
jgi:hypothetical protein